MSKKMSNLKNCSKDWSPAEGVHRKGLSKSIDWHCRPFVAYEDDIFRQPLRRMTVREGRKACFLDTKELCVQKAALIKK